MLRRLIEPSLEWAVVGLPGLMAALDREKPSVVLSSSLPYASQLLCKAARNLGYTFRWAGDFGDPLIGGGGLDADRLWRKIWCRVEKSVLQEMDLITVTTKRTRDLFLKAYPFLEPDRVAVIYNGCDPDEFRFDAPLRAAPVMTYVGSLYYPRVSVEPFLEAMNALKGRSVSQWRDCTVRIVGPVAGEVGRHLVGQAGVVLAGEVPFAESLMEMKSAGVLLLWGNQSGIQIPAKVFQYVGSGRPILCMVSSFEDDLADFLRDYPKAHVVLNEPGAIAAALEEMVPERALADIDARAAQAFIETCTWQGQFQTFEAMLERLLHPS